MTQVYSWQSAKDIIDKYYEKNGIVLQIDGCLCDNYICYGENLKTTIIKEIPLNEWSSGVSIRSYNKTPKKYDKIIDLLEEGEYDQAEKLFFGGK